MTTERTRAHATHCNVKVPVLATHLPAECGDAPPQVATPPFLGRAGFQAVDRVDRSAVALHQVGDRAQNEALAFEHALALEDRRDDLHRVMTASRSRAHRHGGAWDLFEDGGLHRLFD